MTVATTTCSASSVRLVENHSKLVNIIFFLCVSVPTSLLNYFVDILVVRSILRPKLASALISTMSQGTFLILDPEILNQKKRTWTSKPFQNYSYLKSFRTIHAAVMYTTLRKSYKAGPTVSFIY